MNDDYNFLLLYFRYFVLALETVIQADVVVKKLDYVVILLVNFAMVRVAITPQKKTLKTLNYQMREKKMREKKYLILRVVP